MSNSLYQRSVAAILLVLAASCGGSGGAGGAQSGGSSEANRGCDGSCPNSALSREDVSLIVQQAAAATAALGTAGTFAVVDRVGNVLALYQMPGAPAVTSINGQIGARGGLEGAVVPATLAAISKAGTGAYLSSQGNAFSTRTASQIVQEHFLPGQNSQPAGPLFGVQFSQLICGDVTVINPAVAQGVSYGGKPAAGGSVGPRPLPLGLSADPGGLPLYKDGDLVGGVGVEFDGLYTVDRDVSDFDEDPEERVALYASRGFEAPAERLGNNIFVAGRSLRFADIGYSDLEDLEQLPALDSRYLKSELLYSDGTIRAGATFGTPSSGVSRTVRAGVRAEMLVRADGQPRFPTRAGRALDGRELQSFEVEALLDAALLTAQRTRAAIRTPRDSAARVSIFVVDDLGNPLGFARSEDAPLFGADVSLQKARAAAFFSSADAARRLQSVSRLSRDYVSAYSVATGVALDGTYGFGARSVGNLARPYFPDGIDGLPPGPFSLSFPGVAPGASWSPFNTGLQLDLIAGAVVGAIVNPRAVASTCVGASSVGARLRNGIQIFAGGVPLYRDADLVGAIGVSGDGIDQDDLVAFFGASRAGLDYAGHDNVGHSKLGFNAPTSRRADQINLPTDQLRLRYVSCPEAPFIGSNDQNVCDGL
jgi:uncharacterized protein GlcG (DUF336 family)